MFIASSHQVEIFCKEGERYGYVDSQQNAILKVASVALVRQQQSVVRHEHYFSGLDWPTELPESLKDRPMCNSLLGTYGRITTASEHRRHAAKNLEVIIRNNPSSPSPTCPRFDDELRQGKRYRFLNDFSVRWPFRSVYHSPAQEKSMGAREEVRKGLDSSADSFVSRSKGEDSAWPEWLDRTSGKTEASVVCKSKDVRGAEAVPWWGLFNSSAPEQPPATLHQIGCIHQVSCDAARVWIVIVECPAGLCVNWERASGCCLEKATEGVGTVQRREGRRKMEDGRREASHLHWSVEKSIKTLGQI
ncbi:hypothetical protein BU15DRAFT_65188 [Melanogaster broomeanus]|nr:hypothetical protein BU15DRAFT_65188 [Melanogaster broomeanus]